MVGGGNVAEHKVRGLLDAEARVVVVSESFAQGLVDLAEEERVTLIRRAYAPGDLEGAFLAIAATDDPATNAEIFKEAEERRVLLNTVDDIEHCHFAAPSVVRRGDLLLAISTGGKAPALSKRLRRVLSQQFGPDWGRLVEMLGEARTEAIAARDVDFATWAERWQLALDHDLLGMIRATRTEEATQLVRHTLMQGEMPPAGNAAVEPSRAKAARDSAPARERGQVDIVGAGPGDPGLISVKGKELLDAADVVVYDRLVNPSLWKGKAAIYAGKAPGHHCVPQAETNALLIRLAGEGKRVVRLKGGDPFVFGRGAEEAEALAAAGVGFEVVPAPTSAIAALACAGIPITDRRCSSSVAIVTGHCAGGEVDWERLATAVDTIVVLMGLGRLAEIAQRLIAAGRAPETPAAVVENGSLPEQRVVTAELARLPLAVAEAGIGSPSVIVVGEVVRLRDRLSWLEASSSGREGQDQSFDPASSTDTDQIPSGRLDIRAPQR